MSEPTDRVDFNAPESLVEEADTVAELLDTSRTRLLIDALRTQLDEIVADESFRRRLREAYYAGRIDASAVETVLGTEEAQRLELLGDAVDREPPAPDADASDIPPADEFYDGELPVWTPDDAADERATLE